LRCGLVDQREYNWDGRGRALERRRRHRAGTDDYFRCKRDDLRDYLLRLLRVAARPSNIKGYIVAVAPPKLLQTAQQGI
jgi:hypothetical protein